MPRKKTVHLCEVCELPLSTNRTYCDDRCKHIHLCMQSGTTKYKLKHVAPVFQKMIRAEWGAKPDETSLAVVRGVLTQVPRTIGYCVCITCGQVCPWSGGTVTKKLDCGHFLAGRGSILFEEECVAPQCATCNQHHSGRPLEFRQWMLAVHGIEVIEKLERQKRMSVSWTRDDLVDMRIVFNWRLEEAIQKMANRFSK